MRHRTRCHDGDMPPLRFETEPEFERDVARTLAEGEDYLDAWSRLRDLDWRAPARAVHAADSSGEAALCGKPLTALEEFGHKRYPFEQVPHEERCRVCDEAAGSPSA
jgi:hypothetical protein